MRTIHSHCFNLLGLKSENIAERNIKKFNWTHPEFAISIGKLAEDEDENAWNNTRHTEKLFSEMQINRNRLIPEDQWMPDVRSFWKAWSKWMKDAGYLDFTGMLEQVLAQYLLPDIDILFVDEAQDLTPLQIALMTMWSESVDQTIYAGDSDQAVFRFAGTVPEAFIDLEHNWSHHLAQSYRVPRAVHDYAEQIINMAKNREVTTYDPVSSDMAEYKGEGRVYKCISPDMSLEGTHMILCRCKYQIKRWIEILIKNGIIWHNPYRPEDLTWNPMGTQSWIAARAYYDIMKGRDVKAKDFKKMVARLKPGFAKRGMKKDIKEWSGKGNVDLFNLASLGFTDEFIDHIRPVNEVIKLTDRIGSILKRAPSIEDMLFKTPRVVVGTIHSVKGGEADHVWLETSLPPIIWREIRHSNNAFYDECRVAYVAATRAKQTLGLVSTKNWNPVLSQAIK